MIVAVDGNDECAQVYDVCLFHPGDNQLCVLILVQKGREGACFIVSPMCCMSYELFIKNVEVQCIADVFLLVLPVALILQQVIFKGHIDHMRVLLDKCVLHCCKQFVKSALIALDVIYDEHDMQFFLPHLLSYSRKLEFLGNPAYKRTCKRYV